MTNIVRNALARGARSIAQNAKVAADAGKIVYHTSPKIFSKADQLALRKAIGDQVGSLGSPGRLTVTQKVKTLTPGGAKAMRNAALKSASKAVGSASMAGAFIDGALAAKEVVPGTIRGEIKPEIAAEHVGRQALKGGIASGTGTAAVFLVTACTGGIGTVPAVAICVTVSGIAHHKLNKAEARYMPSPFKKSPKLLEA